MAVPSRYQHIINNKDYLLTLENPLKEWSSQTAICSICSNQTFGLVCDLNEISICLPCTKDLFFHIARKEEIAAWHYSRFITALSAEEGLIDRITVLKNYPHVRLLTHKQSPSHVEELQMMLIRNLGYATDHPLAPSVQNLTIEVCNEVGLPLLPLLLAYKRPKNPWPFLANMLSVLGQIAPNDTQVKRLFEDNITHPDLRIRESLARTLKKNIRFDWAKALLQILKDDPGLNAHEIAQQSATLPKKEDALLTIPEQHAIEAENKSILKELVSAISNAYQLDGLRSIFSLYLMDLINESDISAPGLTTSNNFNLSKARKHQLVEMLAQVFLKKDIFSKFYDQLPRSMKILFNALTWEGGIHDPNELHKSLIDICTDAEMVSVEEILVTFPFSEQYLDQWSFNPKKLKCFIFFPDPLRKHLKNFLPKPPGYHFNEISDADIQTQFRSQNTDEILKRLNLFCLYIDQGHIVYTQDDRNVRKSSLNKMIKACHIEEFYKEKFLNTIKTEFIIKLLREIGAKDSKSSHETLKILFTEFFLDKNIANPFPLYFFLLHLNGIHHLTSGYAAHRHAVREKKVKESIYNISRKLPIEKWISVENLIKYCQFHEINLETIDPVFASEHLTLKIDVNEYQLSHSSWDQVEITSAIYAIAIIEPLIKGILFLFASFGICDIAYNLPRNKHLRKRNSDYLSIYDGVEYFRLTTLGAYILGLTDEFQHDVTQEKGQVILDKNRPFIHMRGEDHLKKMVLEKIGEPINENCYKITFNSFLKDCVSHEDINDKMDLFKDHIATSLPKNWQQFFTELKRRIDPVLPNPSFLVFQLQPNQDLISLVSHDEILKKYILKAENYHILIPFQDVAKVKKRLESFGYFIGELN